MGNVLLGISQSVCDDLPDVGVLKIKITTLNCIENWCRNRSNAKCGGSWLSLSFGSSRSDGLLDVSLDNSTPGSSTFNGSEANFV